MEKIKTNSLYGEIKKAVNTNKQIRKIKKKIKVLDKLEKMCKKADLKIYKIGNGRIIIEVFKTSDSILKE